MRFGIFWCPIRFPLVKAREIITATMLLHNFLIEIRLENRLVDRYDTNYFMNFSVNTMVELSDNLSDKLDCLLVDAGEERPRGRPSYAELYWKEQGNELRDAIAFNLQRANVPRLMKKP